MAEHVLRLEGISPINGTLPTTNQGNTAATPLFVTAGFPSGINFYNHQIQDVPGVVAATNFLSVFNPAASGKTLTFYTIAILPWATAATSATTSMLVTRTTAASAGTLVAASTVGKFETQSPNSVTEVRIANPTVTKVGLPLVAIPPAITAAAQGISNTATITPPPGATYDCLPGEGLVFSCALGTVSQLWNLGLVWSEQ